MSAEANGVRSVPWQLSYRTSMLRPDGRPVDILHDFYTPVLQRSVRYDRVAGYFRPGGTSGADAPDRRRRFRSRRRTRHPVW